MIRFLNLIRDIWFISYMYFDMDIEGFFFFLYDGNFMSLLYSWWGIYNKYDFIVVMNYDVKVLGVYKYKDFIGLFDIDWYMVNVMVFEFDN